MSSDEIVISGLLIEVGRGVNEASVTAKIEFAAGSERLIVLPHLTREQAQALAKSLYKAVEIIVRAKP